MQHIKLLLPKNIKCSLTASNSLLKTETNCLFMTRRLLTGVSLADKIQNNESKEMAKEKVNKRTLKERPLTEEQKKKRKEFFLKEEEWERKVDLNILTDRGKSDKNHFSNNHKFNSN